MLSNLAELEDSKFIFSLVHFVSARKFSFQVWAAQSDDTLEWFTK